MMGGGEVILLHGNGWSACKEAETDFESDIQPDRTIKRKLVIRMKGLYDVGAAMSEARGMDVSGVFRFDSGSMIGFNGKLFKRTRIEVEGELNNDFEKIFKTIKNGSFTR